MLFLTETVEGVFHGQAGEGVVDVVVEDLRDGVVWVGEGEEEDYC